MITDESERLIAISEGGRNAAKEGHDDEELENDQKVEPDGTDPYIEFIFGRRRPDSVVIDWANKVMAQLNILVRSLKKVGEVAEGENGGWKIKLIIFVGGTSGSVHAQTLNDNPRK
jgi:hypothetical protein